MAEIKTRTKAAQAARAKKRSDTKPTVSGFLAFGEGDLFPQNIRDAIDDSDTATAAIQARAEFIIGNGIEDEALSDMIVNADGQTLDDVAEGMAWNIAEGEVIIVHVGYTGNGQPCSIRSIPWEQYRHLEPDERGKLTHGGIFPFLGSSYKKDKEKRKFYTLCPLFNDNPDVVLSQIAAVNGIQNYFGQILYVKVGKPSSDYYQQPSYFGSVKNLETEKELTDYDFSVAVNGFNTSGIWKQLAKAKKPSDLETRNGNEIEERDEDSIEARLEEAQGGENAGKILIAEAESIEELDAMGFEPTTGADLADRYSATNDRVMQKIARRMRVPNELVNIRRQGGIAPTGAEMAIASKIMQQSVNKWQRRIDQVLSRILANWYQPLPSPNPKFNLENLNYFADVPVVTTSPTSQTPTTNGTVANP